MLLHHREELHDDLGTGPHEHLALARLLGVVYSIQAIVEDGCADHGGRGWRFSMAGSANEVSVRW